MQHIMCAALAIFSAEPDLTKRSCVSTLLGPSLASIPYAIRGFQCLIVFRKSGDQKQLLNFGKYLTSFPVIWFSALQHWTVPAERIYIDQHDRVLQITWLYAVVLNTLYSFLWDGNILCVLAVRKKLLL